MSNDGCNMTNIECVEAGIVALEAAVNDDNATSQMRWFKIAEDWFAIAARAWAQGWE